MENRSVLKIFCYLAAIFVGIAMSCSMVFAYDQSTTHPELTAGAAEFYNSIKLNSLTDSDVNSLRQGSVDEDNSGRFVNHFYDPINHQGLWGRYLSSKEWAQNILVQASLFGFASQPMSAYSNQTWERALYDYVKGNRPEAMYALGHVLHLIQDATVPEHVRNDAHTGAPGDPKSPLENWAQGPRLAELRVNIATFSKQVPSFNSLDEIFEDTALYTNKNFFSEQTIGFATGYQLPDVQYIGQDESAPGLLVVYGVESGGQLYRLAAKTRPIEWRPGLEEQSNFPLGYSLEHHEVMQDYWPRLSQKAVVNSAATIDLFFREAERMRQNPEVMADWNQSRLQQYANLISGMASKLFGSTLLSGPEIIITPAAQENQPASSDAQMITNADTASIVTPSPLVSSLFHEERADVAGIFVAPSSLPRAASVSPEARIIPSPQVSVSTSPIVSPSPTRLPSPSPTLSLAPLLSPVLPIASPTPSPSIGPPPKLLISEVQISGVSANDEFVELFNPNSFPVDLAGWSIKRKSGTGHEYPLLAVARLDGKTIPAHGYFLAVNEGDYRGVTVADAGWAASNTISADNTILLYSPDASEPIDKVGFGDAIDFENVVALNPTEVGQTLARSSSNDTNNNLNDFILSLPTPRNSQQNAGAFVPPQQWIAIQQSTAHANPSPSPSPEPSTSPSASVTPSPSVPPAVVTIVLNEIQLAGVTVSDEFVELFNPNDFPVNLSNWELRKKTSSGNESNLVNNAQFIGNIAAHSFFLIAPQAGYTGAVAPDLHYSGASYSVASNNTVLLYDGSGRLVDKVGFGTATDYETFATVNPASVQSIERKWNAGTAQDTDHNANDFELKTTPTPENALSPAQLGAVEQSSPVHAQNLRWGRDPDGGYLLAFDYSSYPIVDFNPNNVLERDGLWNAISFYLNQDLPSGLSSPNYDPATGGAPAGVLVSYPTCGGAPAPSMVIFPNDPERYHYQNGDGTFYYRDADCVNQSADFFAGSLPHILNPNSTSPWHLRVGIVGLTGSGSLENLVPSDYLTVAFWRFQTGWDKQWNLKLADTEKNYFYPDLAF